MIIKGALPAVSAAAAGYFIKLKKHSGNRVGVSSRPLTFLRRPRLSPRCRRRRVNILDTLRLPHNEAGWKEANRCVLFPPPGRRNQLSLRCSAAAATGLTRCQGRLGGILCRRAHRDTHSRTLKRSPESPGLPRPPVAPPPAALEPITSIFRRTHTQTASTPPQTPHTHTHTQ